MAVKRRFLFSLLGLFVSTILLAAPSFAYEYQWTGGECIATNNAGFSQANNWIAFDPFAPPTPTSGMNDILIFDGPSGVGMGACTNAPFDDIHGSILLQRPEWGGLYFGSAFDSIVSFSNWGGLTPITAPSGHDVDMIIYGDMVLDAGLPNTYGWRFSSTTTTNKIFTGGAMVLEGGKIDFNVASPFLKYAYEVYWADPFQFEHASLGDGCENNGIDGGFVTLGDITLEGDNMINCYYETGSAININPGPANAWLWTLANNDDLYFKSGEVIFNTQNTISSDFELEQTHASNSITFEDATLKAHPSNPDEVLKIKATHGTVDIISSKLTLATFFMSNNVVTNIIDSIISFDELFFDDPTSTTWLSSEIVYQTNEQLGSDGLGYFANTYDQNLEFFSALAVELSMYPTDLTTEWDYPNYNITLDNVVLTNNQNTGFNIDRFTTYGSAGLGKSSDYYPEAFANEFNFSSPTSLYVEKIHADTYYNLDNAAGSFSNYFNYSEVEYNTLPSISGSTINLLAGGTPHEVRNQLLPASGSTIIQAEINFTWSQEFGVDGYQCQIDEAADNFASPLASWTSPGITNTTHLYDTNLLSQETDYEWRCRTYKDDVNGVTQYSAYNSPANFFYLYAFDNICYNGAAAIDMLSQSTTPTGDTPINRTLFTKNIDYTFVTYNLSNVQLNYTYNDTVYIVTDTASVGAFLNSISTLRSNDKSFSVPLQNTIYDVDMIGTLGNGSVCQTNYQFAVGDISTGGGTGIGNITISDGDGQQQTFAMTFIGAILLIMALIFFYLGKSNKSEVNVYDNDYGR